MIGVIDVRAFGFGFGFGVVVVVAAVLLLGFLEYTIYP